MSSSGSTAGYHKCERPKSNLVCKYKSSRASLNSSNQSHADDFELLYEEEIVLVPGGDRQFSDISISPQRSQDVSSSLLQSSDAFFPPVTLAHSNKSKNQKKRIESFNSLPQSEICPTSLMPNSGESVQAQNSQSVLESIGRELFEEFFLGASKEEDVRKFLKTNEFRLYYKLPVSRNKIPTRLPLQIGYMSSEGKLYHYPVVCQGYGTPQQSWHVVTEESPRASFSSLMSLVRYYKIYSYVNLDTGKVEQFPVPGVHKTQKFTGTYTRLD